MRKRGGPSGKHQEGCFEEGTSEWRSEGENRQHANSWERTFGGAGRAQLVQSLRGKGGRVCARPREGQPAWLESDEAEGEFGRACLPSSLFWFYSTSTYGATAPRRVLGDPHCRQTGLGSMELTVGETDKEQ